MMLSVLQRTSPWFQRPYATSLKWQHATAYLQGLGAWPPIEAHALIVVLAARPGRHLLVNDAVQLALVQSIVNIAPEPHQRPPVGSSPRLCISLVNLAVLPKLDQVLNWPQECPGKAAVLQHSTQRGRSAPKRPCKNPRECWPIASTQQEIIEYTSDVALIAPGEYHSVAVFSTKHSCTTGFTDGSLPSSTVTSRPGVLTPASASPTM
jgi:hypothetical protein